MKALMFAAFVSLITLKCLDAKAQSTAATEYCGGGSFATISAPNPQAALQTLRERCRTGDIIILSGGSTGLIALACDFNRSMISTAGNVICVFSGGRNQRQ